MQDKYAVYRKTENGGIEPLEGDFFVVREKDVFAAQILYGYAHIIQTFLEGLEASGLGVKIPESDYLRDLADDLMMKADIWRNSPDRKIPD